MTVELRKVDCKPSDIDIDRETFELDQAVRQALSNHHAMPTMRVLACCWLEICTALGLDPIDEMQRARTAMTTSRRADA